MEKRESLAGRLGFILLSVGCAVGLGNIWRFPYVVGKYGGGIFVLLYIFFLIVLGFPVLTMELSLGRAGQSNLVGSIRRLSDGNRKWVLPFRISFLGNLLLMLYYTVITGWLIAYAWYYMAGDLASIKNPEAVTAVFDSLTGDPTASAGFMLIAVCSSTVICSAGLRAGVERAVKFMMLILFVLILVLAVYALSTPGCAGGLEFYLRPDWKRFSGNMLETVFAAMGQAFFTLSIGVGSMAVFGSYIDKSRRLAGESILIIVLDTFIALMAGVIIFPICFSFNVDVNSGPGLIFISLPNIFSSMAGGHWWGMIFFIFLALAALTTVVAVFENLIAYLIDEASFSRRAASCFVGGTVALFSLPAVFGFNLLKNFHPLGGNSTILDFEDFIVSQNLLPLGALAIVIFCSGHWKIFVDEANAGSGIRFPERSRWYCTWILPLIILAVWVLGLI